MARPKVYLAAPWKFITVAQVVKAALIEAGVDVISTWTEQEAADNSYDNPDLSVHAMRDRDEVRECDVLLLLNYDKSDGKASEMGMAVILGKRVFVIGGKTGNIFYHLPEVTHLSNFAQFVKALRS